MTRLPAILVPHPHVRSDPGVLCGSPYVVGSRVPVRRLYAHWEREKRVDILFRRYPQLKPAAILDALSFALDNPEVIEADIERERELLERADARRK